MERAYDAELHADAERSLDATVQLQDALRARGVLFDAEPLPTSIKPHFIRRSDNDRWTKLLQELVGVLESTAEQLRGSPSFRSNGPFSAEAWELLDIDPGYRRPAVVCRPDVVWDGDRIGLLEVNADSPAMMLYADVVQDIQRELFPLNKIDQDGLITFDHRIPALLRALLATYRDWGGTKAQPVIAVLDWPRQKTRSEQEQLAREFTKLGCPAFLCSPHELEVRGGRLLGRGEPIDIVQRRLLFPEVVARRDELQPFLTAYRERLACVVNPLRSYLVGCKAILAEMCRRERSDEVTDVERRIIKSVVPCTAMAQMTGSELEERHRWVLKPAFGSGGAGVVIGRYTDQRRWAEAMTTARQGGWIAQTFLPIPLYRVPLTTAAAGVAVPLYANWNPFIFGGVAAGGIARLSTNPVVAISARGALLPSVIVNDE